MSTLPGSIFWAFLLIWQLLWLPQSAPTLQPDPFYWWASLLLTLVSLLAAFSQRRQLGYLTLLLGGLAGLAVVNSVLFRVLVFWSYWAGLGEAAAQHQRLPGRRTRVVLSGYLVTLGLQMFLLLGECWMRYLAWSDDPTRIPCLSYTNTPWKAGPLYASERNSLGLRNPEVSPFKPADTTRILFLGDSVTFGLGVPQQDTFVRLVEKRLPGKCELVNMSAAGLNLEQEIRGVMTQGQYYESDAVVWVFFPNDIEHMGWDMPFSGIQPCLDSLYRSWLFYQYLAANYNIAAGALGFRTSYLSALQKAYDEDATYGRFAQQMGLLASWCRRNQKKLAIVIFPFMEDLGNYPLKNAQARVMRTAQELGVPTLDLTPVFEKQVTTQMQLNPRFDHHPSAAANHLAAEEMVPFLTRVFQLGAK